MCVCAFVRTRESEGEAVAAVMARGLEGIGR